MRVASGLTLFALARGQGINCGEPEPVYSVAAFTTRNPSPDECRSPDGASLSGVDWGRVVTACQGIIPSTYTGAPYGVGTTAEQCRADLCEATPECTAAIEAWGNDLESCNPAGNYMQVVYRAKAWRDACIGARAKPAPTSPRATTSNDLAETVAQVIPTLQAPRRHPPTLSLRRHRLQQQ